MIFSNKMYVSIALSLSLLFGSITPAFGARTASIRMPVTKKTPVAVAQDPQSPASNEQVLNQETPNNAKKSKKQLSWKTKINQKFQNLKDRISNFFHDNPEVTVASLAIGSALCIAIAVWSLWNEFAAPAHLVPPVDPAQPDNRAAAPAQPVPNPVPPVDPAAPQAQPLANPVPTDNPDNANANSVVPNAPAPAQQQQENQQPQQPPLPPVPWVATENVVANSACDVLELALPQGHNHQLINYFERRRINFRLGAPTRIVQLRCADQNGPECGYHAIKNSMVILNELANPQGNLQARLADDALCQQFFGFDPEHGHGIWRQRILAVLPPQAIRQLQARSDAIGHRIYINNERIEDLQDLIDAEDNVQAREALVAAQLELRNQRVELDNERARLNQERRQPNNIPNPGGLPCDEGNQHGDWLRAGALQHIIEHEQRRPADNEPQLLQDFNTPITVIEQAEQIGTRIPGADPSLAARAGFARPGAYRHAFIVTTAQQNARNQNGHYFAAVVDRNADGLIRWYVADSMNRPILHYHVLRNLIVAVQGIQV